MLSNFAFVIFVIIFHSDQYVTNGLVCKGCLELDDLTFDKVLSKFSTVLVKFDVAFPYGKQHDEYAKFAKEISGENVDDMAVTVVGIKNYGDTTNHVLAERFHIEKKLPAIKLFTNGDTLNWLNFPNDQNVTVKNLSQFVRRKSTAKIVLDDCLKQFDELSAEFMRSVQHALDPAKEAASIVDRAQNEATNLETEHKKQIAQIYMLFMQRTLERGISFIGAERMRLQQLLDGKISDQKRKEINQKLNILSAFNVIEKPASRTEL